MQRISVSRIYINENALALPNMVFECSLVAVGLCATLFYAQCKLCASILGVPLSLDLVWPSASGAIRFLTRWNTI